MSTPYSEDQIARLAQFRRNRRAIDSSVSDFASNSPDRDIPADGNGNAPADPRAIEFSRIFASAAAAAPSSQAPSVVSLSGPPRPVGNPTLLPPPPSLVGGQKQQPLVGGEDNLRALSALRQMLGGNHNNATAHLAVASASLPPPPSSSLPVSRLETSNTAGAPTTPAINSASSVKSPNDGLAAYILDIERQNLELRNHIQFLQDAVLQQQRDTAATGHAPKHDDMFDTVSNHAKSATMLSGLSEEDKRLFLNEVLSQIDFVIQAHRNKTAVEIQKYRAEAEEARKNLQQLRDAIHQEGLDLSLAPATVLMQKKYAQALHAVERNPASANSNGGDHESETVASFRVANIPPQAQHMLEAIAQDILQRLSSIQDGEDIAVLVKEAVEISFEALVTHFTNQLAEQVQETLSVADNAKAELASAKEQLRAQLTVSENQRVALTEKYELMLQALRDQLRAYHLATTQDDLQATIQEKTLDEYTTLLVEARGEVTRLQRALEDEKNHAAQVCLKLKSALQKRNADFEKAVVQQAEQVLESKQKRIAELEQHLRQQSSANRVPTTERGVQTANDGYAAASSYTFIPNIVHAVVSAKSAASQHVSTPFHNSSNSAAHATPAKTPLQQLTLAPNVSSAAFEGEVLRKTQELIQKYNTSLHRKGDDTSSFVAPSPVVALATPARR